MKNLKPILLSLLVTFLSINSLKSNDYVNKGDGEKVKINKVEFDKLTPELQETALDLKERLNTAFAVNKKDLNKDEKSELKNEIKALKTELKEFQKRATGNGGIYISTGGLIIIILLLIIIL